MIGSAERTPVYIAVKNDIDGEATLNSIHKNSSISSQLSRAFSLNAWSLATLILLILLFSGPLPQGHCPTEELIWATPDTDKTEALQQFEKRRFTYPVRDDSHGHLYTPMDPNDLQFAGLPTEQIDKNWKDLIAGRYFRLEDSEIELLSQDPDSPALTKMSSNDRIAEEGFYGGPDVLHSLHCLNAIRKHLDRDYYAGSMTIPPEYRRLHVDHCVDHLRQALLCHGDLTPVTMKPVVANTSLPYPVTFYLGQTEREHTCRSAEAIRNWVTERGQRTGIIE
ncbi:hypothetical protein N7448_011386 [Penicillium atrosanguineum]|uniref:Oxidase ustYa n=1 Tax=Penicillium atrosanguineum TaxID=1132637 RepID=A0A9W9U5B7_9EURO|nr:hypothetical protein N7526_011500 [Penicillium atrosanguineum]KAJ5117754.1 hypothetical protein N7448_011386 [Penicillium atrosanguineum]KAJ5318703.1 hypothetical protein N7476_005123 [Penicillium atrosanguineum]